MIKGIQQDHHTSNKSSLVFFHNPPHSCEHSSSPCHVSHFLMLFCHQQCSVCRGLYLSVQFPLRGGVCMGMQVNDTEGMEAAPASGQAAWPQTLSSLGRCDGLRKCKAATSPLEFIHPKLACPTGTPMEVLSSLMFICHSSKHFQQILNYQFPSSPKH